MLVKVDLNEVDVDKLRTGLEVEITVDALPDARYTGRVTRIAPASRVEQREPGSAIVRFPIEVTVEDADVALRPGMTANVEILCEAAKDVLWVPNDALFEKEDEDGKKYVCIVPAGEEEKGKQETEDRQQDQLHFG